jgi:transposase-like protein
MRAAPLGAFATTDRTQAVYPVVLIDAIVGKIRDGQVANRPVYVAMGITVDGERDCATAGSPTCASSAATA